MKKWKIFNLISKDTSLLTIYYISLLSKKIPKRAPIKSHHKFTFFFEIINEKAITRIGINIRHPFFHGAVYATTSQPTRGLRWSPIYLHEN